MKFSFSFVLLALAVTLSFGCSDDDEFSSPTWTCEQSCEYSIGCDNDPVDDCLTQCQVLLATCPAETQASLDCGANTPETDFECDEDGETSPKDGVCSETFTAVLDCLVAAGAN